MKRPTTIDTTDEGTSLHLSNEKFGFRPGVLSSCLLYVSDVPGDEGNGRDHSRKYNRGVDWSEDAPHSGYDQDRYPSQQAHPSRFDEDSMSGGVLLYNLDCGTLEPPSPQPPSPEQQGGGRDNVGTEGGQQSTGIGRRKKRREKRTMTSLYVRYCLACLFLLHARTNGMVIVGIGMA